MGSNGAGKSTVFEVLQKLQSFIQDQDKLNKIFHYSTLTRWQDSLVQEFELEIDIQSDTFTYQFAVGFHADTHEPSISYERLWQNDELLSKYEENIFVVDFQSSTADLPWRRSEDVVFDRTLFTLIADTPTTKDIIRFRRAIGRLLVVQIIPSSLEMDSEKESRVLQPDAKNFVSWYRYISEQSQGNVLEITQELSEILDGFRYFKLEERGSYFRELWVVFDGDDEVVQYRFDELSDGQRKLIVLYTILTYAKNQNYVVCIDEPANYLALEEVQPWAVALDDICSDGTLQALITSHHPELINYLVFSKAAIWFSRENNRAKTTAAPFPAQNDYDLPVTELVARGWVDG